MTLGQVNYSKSRIESRGNELAKQYLEKLRNKKVSIDWAHIVLINRIREQNELIRFIVSEMKKEGLEMFRALEYEKERRQCASVHEVIRVLIFETLMKEKNAAKSVTPTQPGSVQASRVVTPQRKSPV